jgi:hypothetical protein
MSDATGSFGLRGDDPVFVISYPVNESYFETKETEGKFFLQWDRYNGVFHFGVNTPGSPVRKMQNPTYAYAKTQKDARALAAKFFADKSAQEGE